MNVGSDGARRAAAATLAATLRWTLALTAVALVALQLTNSNTWGAWPWGPFAGTLARLTTLLPFAAFAGGVAAGWVRTSQRQQAAGMFAATLAIAIVAYVGSAVVVPLAEYRSDAAMGVDLELIYPTGPDTPGGLRALRDSVRADPPASYLPSVHEPLRQPPSWTTYLLHQPAAFSAFALLNALLGLLCAGATLALPPPMRRQTCWALGLLAAVTYFVVASAGGVWVRADFTRSGALGAWIPLAVPLLELAVAWVVLRVRGVAVLHAAGGSRV